MTDNYNQLPTIVSVDDEDTVRFVIQKILETPFNGKIKVITFSSGNEFLDAIDKIPENSLAFIDMIMPGINGPDVVEKIKDSKITKYIYSGHLSSNSQLERIKELTQSKIIKENILKTGNVMRDIIPVVKEFLEKSKA